MGLKAFVAKILAHRAKRKVAAWSDNAITAQHKIRKELIKTAQKTQFGKDHDFAQIHDLSDFQRCVPINDYESLKIYIDKMLMGQADILWPGKPKYFSKTSGTTSGSKFIPISKESMPHHIVAAKNALLLYIANTGKSDFVNGKMIFLQGSPVLHKKNGTDIGRLSGIVAHHVPKYLQANRLPSFETNSISDWETKVEAIIDETVCEPMTLISGIPSWVQFYFERLLKRTGKSSISEIFPEFSLFVYGGVNFEPYRKRFLQLIGRNVASIETYPASEGFIAFQSIMNDQSLLLNVDAGMFFEFIPAEKFFDDHPPRLTLEEVQIGINYALILSTNAGLWGYSIGDTVKFTSVKPYKILVTGRIKHFTSAFGEHVIAEEVEGAMKVALQSNESEVVEFTVAPQIEPVQGLPYHEWFIAFAKSPTDMANFASILDEEMQYRNSYYADLVKGGILRPLQITSLQSDAFNHYMKSKGKLGGQNKIPRLSNDRSIAEVITKWQKI